MRGCVQDEFLFIYMEFLVIGAVRDSLIGIRCCYKEMTFEEPEASHNF